MKKSDWRVPVLIGIAAVAVIASFFSPTLVVSLSVCFLGILIYLSWDKWLDAREKNELREKMEPLEKSIASKDREIAELRGNLNELETKLKNIKPEPLPAEKRLFDLAEKLRTKTILQTETNKPAVQTTDEVPAEVRDFIIKNFPKS